MIGVGAVEHKAVGLAVILHSIIDGQGFHQPSCHTGISGPLARLHVTRHLQETAGRNGGGRGIPWLLISIPKFQIPERYQVLWKAPEKIICHAFEQIDVRRFPGIPVSNGCTVDTPGLASGPGRAVPVALAGGAMVRLPCFPVKEEGVPGGKIRADYIGQGCADMGLGYIPVLGMVHTHQRLRIQELPGFHRISARLGL